jgi:hypothetical protein
VSHDRHAALAGAPIRIKLRIDGEGRLDIMRIENVFSVGRGLLVTTRAQLAEGPQALFTTVADDLARRSWCVERRSKLTGAVLAQALVFGWRLQRPWPG